MNLFQANIVPTGPRGDQRLSIRNTDLDFRIADADVKMNNLFNGEFPLVAERANQFISENNNLVSEENSGDDVSLFVCGVGRDRGFLRPCPTTAGPLPNPYAYTHVIITSPSPHTGRLPLYFLKGTSGHRALQFPKERGLFPFPSDRWRMETMMLLTMTVKMMKVKIMSLAMVMVVVKTTMMTSFDCDDDNNDVNDKILPLPLGD